MSGLIHIYCGDGKGKTTAALGLSLRAAGRGMQVCIVQFLKSTETGELNILRQIPNVQVIRSQEQLGFTFRMNEEQKRHAAMVQQELFAKASVTALSGSCDLLVLDEIMAAINSGMVEGKAGKTAALRQARGAGSGIDRQKSTSGTDRACGLCFTNPEGQTSI